MKINGWLLFLSASLFLAFTGFAQTPPPNDNYSNRIVLNGSDLTFTGNLAGATVEGDQEASWYNPVFNGMHPATESIWWSWTAQESSTLTLDIVKTTADLTVFGYPAGLAVYSATNGSLTPGGLILPPLASQLIVFLLFPQSISIPVTAGTEYEIQLLGQNSGSYTMHLVATNQPYILQQPRNVTVNSNATALFYVIAAGINQSNFTFQWLYNGAPLAGETAPMLAISNVDTNVTGAYSVIVSNSAGATFSDAAMLNVSQTNVPNTLAYIGTQSNSLAVALAGEPGRNYRIETSPDLTTWTRYPLFPQTPFGGIPATSVVYYDPASPLTISVPRDLPLKFIHAVPYAPSPQSANVCINHLAQIQVAKMLWQRDVKPNFTASPSLADLLPYFPRHQAPLCPIDGAQTFATSYTISDLGTLPSCRIFSLSHNIEAPR
jgi:hypothetical protein